MRDRRRYLYWLFEAKKRYGLSVLNGRASMSDNAQCWNWNLSSSVSGFALAKSVG
jgi:hypothetical protein